MYRSILVPLDGSPFSEFALPVALNVAKRAGASLQVVRVCRQPRHWPPIPESPDADPFRTWKPYLNQVVDRLRALAPVPISAELLEGDETAATIEAHAGRVGADLVVMTTHGRGTLGQFWLGSVAYELLGCSPLPLLLVRPHGGSPGWADEPAPRRVLLALDGSEPAEHIIEPAVALGQLYAADYTLLRVIEEVPLGTSEFDAVSLSSLAPEVLSHIHAAEEKARREAADYLERVAGGLRDRGLRVETQVTAGADPGGVILEEAARKPFDFVSIETQGRRGLMRRLMGSVSRKVIHGASVPVLVQSAAVHRKSDTLCQSP